MEKVVEKMNIVNHKRNYLILTILVLLNLFLFSGVSPIHSIYNMQYDEWVYYLIGKGITKGLVPYVDLLDHKGPYLFFIFALANLINFKHIGLFVVESIVYVLIAIYSYKISYLILEKITTDIEEKANEYISIIVSFIIYCISSSYYISFGSISAETLILPFILMTYSLFIDIILNDKSFYDKRFIITSGLSAGITFFIKGNAILCFIPIAIYIFIDLMIKKEYKKLMLITILGIGTFIISLIPAFIYCIVTNSLNDMINGAFIINMFYIGAGMPSSKTLFDSFFDTLLAFKEWTILCIFSVFLIWRLISSLEKNIKYRFMAFYVLSLFFNIYAVYMSFRPYTNYLNYLIFYFIPIVLFFVKSFVNIFLNNNDENLLFKNIMSMKILFIIILLVINILSYSFSFEISSINGITQNRLANQVLKVYKNKLDKIKNVKLLVVGYEPYIYEAFDTLPNERYFAIPVVNREKYEEPYEALIEKIKEGSEEVVVVSFGRGMIKDAEFRENVYDALSDKYEKIGDAKSVNLKAEVYVLK